MEWILLVFSFAEKILKISELHFIIDRFTLLWFAMHYFFLMFETFLYFEKQKIEYSIFEFGDDSYVYFITFWYRELNNLKIDP